MALLVENLCNKYLCRINSQPIRLRPAGAQPYGLGCEIKRVYLGLPEKVQKLAT
jgi:hypothetical protein